MKSNADIPVDTALLAQYHARRPQEARPRYRSFQRQYLDDPVAFVRDCLEFPDGGGPAPYQEEILDNYARHERSSARGPRGLGKTAIGAWVTLHTALTADGDRDWKVPTLAGSWRQVEEFLWPEINYWASRVRWGRVGREALSPSQELFQLSLKLRTGHAFGMASDKPKLLEGVHASVLTLLVDEAKSVIQETFDAMEGAFSTPGRIREVVISTPGAPSGYFHSVHTHDVGFEEWAVRHVTVDEALRAGRVTSRWVESCRRMWGQDSAMFRNHCLGEFAAPDDSGIIPTSWVDLAVARWRALEASGSLAKLPTDRHGVDVARSGRDDNVRAAMSGPWVVRLSRWDGTDTMATAGVVRVALAREGGEARVDINNVGAGVYDRLSEDGLDVVPFVGQSATDARDATETLGFANLRSYAWWSMREWLDPANGKDAALPDDPKLRRDLATPRYRINSGGRIALEPKESVVKRLGRSTDAGDAVAMAVVAFDPKEVEFF